MVKNQTMRIKDHKEGRKRSWDPKGKAQAQSREQELQKQQMGGGDVVPPVVILLILRDY